MLQFELVSPEELVLSKQAAMVTVPGGEGDYGVLAGHAPMITTVRAGVIEVFDRDNGAATDRIFVAGGFAEVTNERCTVLAEQAIPVSALDRTQIEEEVRDLETSYTRANDAERSHLESQLAVAKAKLQAIQ